jgi:osmotically-inducible protein OsmY
LIINKVWVGNGSGCGGDRLVRVSAGIVMPPIHILVENGRVTLKGAAASQLESQLVYTAANQVPGVFEVLNELHTDN